MLQNYFRVAIFTVVLAGQRYVAAAACASNGLDLSPLKGKEFSTSLGGYNYNMNVCGTSEQKCPDDPDGIFTGMIVQTKPSGLRKSPCFVLGQYDEDASWTAIKGPPAGTQLTMKNGSPNDCPEGFPRTVEINFVCASGTEPASGQFKVKNQKCDYVVDFPTCYACTGGCIKIATSNFFGRTFLVVFAITASIYVVLGTAINKFAYKMPLSEAFPNKGFWSSFFSDFVSGISFTFGLCSGAGGSSSGSDKYQASAGSGNENPYNTA